MQRFENKIVLITGAGSGIGRATAKRLASEGARLMLVDRNAEGLTETLQQLPEHTETLHRELDVSDEAAVEQCVADTVAHFGRLDVLCNNAGIAGGDYSLATDQNMETWQKIINVNLFGVVLFTKYASRQMREQNGGAIVNTASVAGIRSGAHAVACGRRPAPLLADIAADHIIITGRHLITDLVGLGPLVLGFLGQQIRQSTGAGFLLLALQSGDAFGFRLGFSLLLALGFLSGAAASLFLTLARLLSGLALGFFLGGLLFGLFLGQSSGRLGTPC